MSSTYQSRQSDPELSSEPFTGPFGFIIAFLIVLGLIVWSTYILSRPSSNLPEDSTSSIRRQPQDTPIADPGERGERAISAINSNQPSETPTASDTPIPKTSSPRAATRREILRNAIAYLKEKGYQIIPPNQDSNLPEHRTGPDAESTAIWRTVITEDGFGSNKTKKYCEFNKEDYDSVRDSGFENNAIELIKEVRIVPRSDRTGSLTCSQRGNKALQGDVVQEIKSEKIVVRCPLLCKAIRETVYWPSASFYGGARNLNIDVPYRSIGAHREKLAELQKSLEDKIAISSKADSCTPALVEQSETQVGDSDNPGADDRRLLRNLKLFLEQVDTVQKAGSDETRARIKRGFITFDYLWAILKPGVFAYANLDGEEIACRIRLLVWGGGGIDPRLSASSEDHPRSVTAHIWFVDHKGTCLDRRAHKVDIHRFEGEKPIATLRVYPREYAPDSEQKQKNKIDEGRRYLELIHNHFSLCLHSGMLSFDDPLKSPNRRDHSGKVMVDPELYYREHSDSNNWMDESDLQYPTSGYQMREFVKVPVLMAQHQSSTNKTIEHSDDLCFLLCSYIRGFTLSLRGDRKWAYFRIENLRQYEYDRSLIHTVALCEDDLDVIRCLTDRPDSLSNDENVHELDFSPDHINHKGDGYVVVFHGYPGLGKTYTVECISEYSQRPLVRLTCAELGLNPTKMESTLANYLAWAERWKALVLIDEADIFLRKRSSPETTIDSEGIVTVFLKALEYYSGIMFLTTNRVASFDRAAIDRASLIIQFSLPDAGNRSKILGNCLSKLSESQTIKLDASGESFFRKEVVENQNGYQWNGREITQVLKLAAMEAQSKNNELDKNRRKLQAVITEAMIMKATKRVMRHLSYETDIKKQEDGSQQRDKEMGWYEDQIC